MLRGEEPPGAGGAEEEGEGRRPAERPSRGKGMEGLGRAGKTEERGRQGASDQTDGGDQKGDRCLSLSSLHGPPAGTSPAAGREGSDTSPSCSWTWVSVQTWRRDGARWQGRAGPTSACPLVGVQLPRASSSPVMVRPQPPRHLTRGPAFTTVGPEFSASLCPGSGEVPGAGGKPVTPSGGRCKERGSHCVLREEEASLAPAAVGTACAAQPAGRELL